MYVGVVLLGLIWEAIRYRFRVSQESQAQALPQLYPLTIPLAALGILLLFTAQLWTIAFMARHQIAPPCWLQLPIPVVADLGEDTGGPAQALPSFLLAILAAAQSFLLYLMYRAREAVRHPRSEFIVACIALLAIVEAVFAPAMTSPDVFYYMTYAKLGFASYVAQPQAVNIPGLPMKDWCEERILPSAYGPAFISYIKLLPSWSPVAQVLLVRAMNALWFLALLGLLRATGSALPIVWLAALNPALLSQYIATPHNDLIATVFVLLGVVMVSRSSWIAASAVLLAALFKLSFALVGVLVFVRLPTLGKRLCAAAIVFAASFVLSYLLAGPKYFAGLSYYDHLLAPEANRLQYLLVAVTLGACGYALLRQGFSRAAVYAFPALRIQAIFPWYAIWSLPYALLADSVKSQQARLSSFLILMPLMTLLMETGIARSAQITAYVLVSALIIAGIMRDLQGTRPHA